MVPYLGGEYTLSDLKKEVLGARVLYILQTAIGEVQCLTAHREDNARERARSPLSRHAWKHISYLSLVACRAAADDGA